MIAVIESNDEHRLTFVLYSIGVTMKQSYWLVLAALPLGAASIVALMPALKLNFTQPAAATANNLTLSTASPNTTAPAPPPSSLASTTTWPANASTAPGSASPKAASAFANLGNSGSAVPVGAQLSTPQSTQPRNSAASAARASRLNQPAPINSQGAATASPASVAATAAPIIDPAAQRLAVLTGRRILSQDDVDNTPAPFRHVGWITNESCPEIAVGSGTLIGPQHVLTAAHVLEAVILRADTWGAPVFRMLNGQMGKIVDEELDAGWKKKIISFDLGVCKLDQDFLDFEETGAEIDSVELDYRDYDHPIHCVGYDMDLFMAAPSQVYPMVVDRVGLIKPLNSSKKKASELLEKYLELGENIPLKMKLEKKFEFGKLDGKMETETSPLGWIYTGVGIVTAEYFAIQGHLYDRIGWDSECIGATGVDGGPIWVEIPVVEGGKTYSPIFKIIGVIGIPRGDIDLGRGVRVGTLAGSKITEGAAHDMIHNFAP